jgi:hypothetical protein
MLSRRTVLFVSAALVSLGPPLTGQQANPDPPLRSVAARPLLAVRMNTTPFRIDGLLDEPLWRAVPALSAFTQREPVEGAPATHATDVRMIITEDAVIIGAQLADEPAALAALRSVRDPVGTGALEDYFEVQLDPHPGHLTAFALAVSPAGLKRSWIVARDGSRDASWSVQWDVATHIDRDGWTVEIRIPLSQFHLTPGREQWAAQFVRFSYERQETDVYYFSEPKRSVAGAASER